MSDRGCLTGGHMIRETRALENEEGYYAPMEDLSLDIRRYVGERLGDPNG